jgi:hypothetical protein
MSIINKLFLVKEIKSKAGELHFRRWRIFQTPWLSAYVHRIYKSDEDKHCHSHPWRFVALILSGGYLEYDEHGDFKVNTPGTIVKVGPDDFHKVKLFDDEPSTSIVITGPRKYPWGYIVGDSKIYHTRYRKMKNDGTL